MNTEPKSNGAISKTLNDDTTPFYSSEIGLVNPDIGQIDDQVINNIQNEIKQINEKLDRLFTTISSYRSEISTLKNDIKLICKTSSIQIE